MQIEATPSLDQLLAHVFDKGTHPIDLFLENGEISLSYGIMKESGDIAPQSDDYIDFMSRLDAIISNNKIRARVVLDCENLLNDHPKLILSL